MGLETDAGAWLDLFAARMRARDIRGGREMFDAAVWAFGTRVDFAHDLDDLVARQWAPTWFSSAEFRFIDESMLTMASADGDVVVVLARWESLGGGFVRSTAPRQGRCTIVLRRDASRPCGMRCVHTHFSETPQAAM